MNWKIWLILISVVIYCIWAIFLNYTVVKKVERDYYGRKVGKTTYEKLPIPIWLILVVLVTLFVPILNIIGSIAIFWIYLSAMGEVYYDGVELQAKDDWFCNLLHNIGDFLSKPIN